tara:strand:+ start:75 stop:332 length:258 start_codon:yes stop_codon:yes gene_type:complete
MIDDDLKKDITEEELLTMYSHTEIAQLTSELLIDKKVEPLIVAGVLMAAASKIYQDILTKQEFQDLMNTVAESTIDNIKFGRTYH